MRVIMVAARARNHVIGNRGKIPWRIPADFAHFKSVTIGHPLILGRTTFEGIGKPLPDRQSIVLTRDPNWSYDGVLVASTVEDALDIAAELDPVINIGGGAAVYDAAMPHATHQILTEVRAEPEGDTYYPEFVEDEWHEFGRVNHLEDETPWVIR
jgi:dihydrofolate reductase